MSKRGDEKAMYIADGTKQRKYSSRLDAMVALARQRGMSYGQMMANTSLGERNHLLANMVEKGQYDKAPTEPKASKKTYNKPETGDYSALDGGAKPHLTEEQVMEILHSKEPYSVIADQYGIADRTVSDIKTGRSWTHIYKQFKEAG